MSIPEDESLEHFARSGVLPMQINKTGRDDDPLLEVIICDSISGGAAYENNMPEEVTLVRRLVDGSEHRALYVQLDDCFRIKKV